MEQTRTTWQIIEQLVLGEIRSLLVDRGKRSEDLLLDDALDADLGLSSSDVVELVAVLTAKIGVDPFRQSKSIVDARTVGDLCRLFDHERAPSGGDGADDAGRGDPPPGAEPWSAP